MKDLVPEIEFTAGVPVPEDNDYATAASVEPGFQALTNRTEYLKTLAPAYPVVIPASAFTPGSGAIYTY